MRVLVVAMRVAEFKSMFAVGQRPCYDIRVKTGAMDARHGELAVSVACVFAELARAHAGAC